VSTVDDAMYSRFTIVHVQYRVFWKKRFAGPEKSWNVF